MPFDANFLNLHIELELNQLLNQQNFKALCRYALEQNPTSPIIYTEVILPELTRLFNEELQRMEQQIHHKPTLADTKQKLMADQEDQRQTIQRQSYLSLLHSMAKINPQPNDFHLIINDLINNYVPNRQSTHIEEVLLNQKEYERNQQALWHTYSDHPSANLGNELNQKINRLKWEALGLSIGSGCSFALATVCLTLALSPLFLLSGLEDLIFLWGLSASVISGVFLISLLIAPIFAIATYYCFTNLISPLYIAELTVQQNIQDHKAFLTTCDEVETQRAKFEGKKQVSDRMLTDAATRLQASFFGTCSVSEGRETTMDVCSGTSQQM
jgi:hypothetical protein